jgi:uncharacterized repeat protein (TIGR03803 family)
MKTSKSASASIFMILATLFFAGLVLTSAARAAAPERIVASFDGADGTLPTGLSIDVAGNLWGVTAEGGTGDCTQEKRVGCGTVFELTPTSGGWEAKRIYSFQGGSDGANPTGNLTFDTEGNVYGTTIGGGLGYGTVYELSPQSVGYQEAVIYAFNDTATHNDGIGPSAGLVLDGTGNLYGTTGSGGNGCSLGCGTVYELSPASGGWTESLLYNFKGSANDGWLPVAPVTLDSHGDLYGTTELGGTWSYGVVFELTPSSGGGWTESVLHSFQGNEDHANDGAKPETGLTIDAAGNLYGVTLYGGNKSCDNPVGCGVVYELSPASGSAWTETIIHAFHGPDGYDPSGLVMGAAGNLYGVTSYGGAYGFGTAFELTPSSGGWSESMLHSFGNGKDGQGPGTPPVFDSAGNLYGTTMFGGAHVTLACGNAPTGCGTVFQLEP